MYEDRPDDPFEEERQEHEAAQWSFVEQDDWGTSSVNPSNWDE